MPEVPPSQNFALDSRRCWLLMVHNSYPPSLLQARILWVDAGAGAPGGGNRAGDSSNSFGTVKRVRNTGVSPCLLAASCAASAVVFRFPLLWALCAQVLTIIGIPTAVTSVQMALFALWPFGQGARLQMDASILSCVH